MDLSTVPGCSPDIYLQDISPDVRALEGDCPQENRIFVTVNYANEGDRIDLESISSRRETHISPIEVVEYRSVNEREQVEMRVFLTLNYVRNLDRDGQPIFSVAPARDMGLAFFKAAWRSLPPAIADAIHTAVLIHNPEWGWEG